MYQRTLTVFALLVALTLVAVQPAEAIASVLYTAPVDDPQVIRNFDPPGVPWGSGHRGVDFAVNAGATVYAAADGSVTFAGSVGNHTWVSITHADMRVTTYGPLTAVSVKRGDMVRRNTPIARLAPGGHGSNNSDTGLHFSLRYDGTYRDPLTVLETIGSQVTLVGQSLWLAAGAPLKAGGGWRGNRAGGLLVARSQKATLPYAYHPPNANHLVLVAGLSSSSASGMPDPQLLGYDADSVTRYAYNATADEYGPEHTWEGPFAHVMAYAQMMRDIARRHPGRAVDVVAHSQGGLIALAFLLTHNPLTDSSLPPIGNVVLIGSPVSGSDLAALATMVSDELGLGKALNAAQRVTGIARDTLPLDAPAINVLDPHAEQIRRFGVMWEQAWQLALNENPSGPVALRPKVLSIAGATDAVVLAGRTRVSRGALPALSDEYLKEWVLPGGHASVKHTDAAHEIVWRFFAGETLSEADGHLSHAVSGVVRGGLNVTRFAINELLLPRFQGSAGCSGIFGLLSRC